MSVRTELRKRAGAHLRHVDDSASSPLLAGFHDYLNDVAGADGDHEDDTPSRLNQRGGCATTSRPL